MIEITDFLDRLPNDWKPKSPAQKMALLCPAEILNFGGAAGSLKSETTLVDALKYVHRPEYRAVIFRKTYPELEFLIDRTRTLYAGMGGRIYEGNKPEWRFPWGAVIEFRHMDKPKDVYKHQGPAYQYVAFDESTHQPEFVLRYIFNSRMRSTSGIPLRMRLPTNPGNIGHNFHKFMFQGPKCVHCILKEAELTGLPPKWLPDSRKPGVIYNDSRWYSDKELVGATTCFIPGRVRDHDLFGEKGGDYADKRLRGLPAALREALLEGCWEEFEGQYFDCFDKDAHVIDREKINAKNWWPYWISIDWGFAHACVAYLHTMDPSTNHVYTLEEYMVKRRKDSDVAMDLKKMWNGYNLRGGWYLSPDAFKHDGKTDFSSAELMSQATGIYFEKAYNDRISGARLMYGLLDDRKWSICSSCELLIASLPTRKHGELHAEDVEKVETEDEDDAYDAARYGLASYINPTERPQEEELQELIANEFSTDPTMRMMQIQAYLAKKNKLGQSVNYRSRGRR